MKTRVGCGVVLAAFFTLLSADTAFGQIGVWKNYTSMQDVRAITRNGNTFWAATSGGLFAWTEGTESYQKFTSAEGLQSTDLTAVAIDKNGDVWTGTSTGIIHVYSPRANTWRYVPDIAGANQTNKRVNNISIVGDTVLISTGFGLSVFQIKQFQFADTYTKFGSLSGSVRVAVSSAAIFDGKIWATVSDGQSTSRTASASLSNPNLLPPEAWTLQIVGDATTIPKHLAVFNNRLYVGTSRGLFMLNGNAWISNDSLSGRNVTALASSANILSIVDASGIVSTVSSQNVFARFGAQVSFAVTSVAINSAERPVVATINGGVMTFQTSWTSHFPNGPASNAFLSIAVDLDGNVWGGSGIDGNGKGFYRFDGKSKLWKTFTRQNSPLLADDYWRASVACNGDVWLGCWGNTAGVVLMPRGAENVDTTRIFGRNVGISHIPGSPNYLVIGQAVCDNSGNTWMTVMIPEDKHTLAVRKADGTWNTLPVYVAGVPQRYLTDREVTRPLTVDASNNIWASVVTDGNRGVVCLNNRGSVTDSIADVYLTSANGLPSDVVRTIVADRDDDIWIGTDRGIAIILDPGNPTRSGGIASYKPLSGLGINAIAVDPLNQKWIASNEGALLLSRDGTQTLAQFNVANTNGKIIDNEIKDIAIDAKTGTVYFATASGLASLTTTSAQPKAEFDEITVSPNPYKIPNTVALTIDGLVENSKIKILTIDGHLVRELQTPGGRIGFWDGKDRDGNHVASGVYLVVAYSATEKDKVGKGKVAVLRR